MLAQAVDHGIFVSFFHFFLHFFQGEMHDVVMVHFQRRYGVAEAQPQPVQEINFVRRQVRQTRILGERELDPEETSENWLQRQGSNLQPAG